MIFFLSANEFGTLGNINDNNYESNRKEKKFEVKTYSFLSEFYDKVKKIGNTKGKIMPNIIRT